MLRIRSPTILLHNVKKLYRYKTNKKFFQKSESFKPKSTTIFWLSLIFHDNFLYTNYCNGWIRQNNSQSAENLLAKHLTMCRRRRRRKILVPCDQVDDGISYNCLRLYRQHIKKRLAHTHTRPVHMGLGRISRIFYAKKGRKSRDTVPWTTGILKFSKRSPK